MAEPRTITTVLFDGFELLDVCGPLELFGVLPDQFRLVLAGPGLAPVASRQGPALRPDTDYASAPPPGIVLVPGGQGTRPLVTDRDFLDWLTLWSARRNWSPRCAPGRPCWPRPACWTATAPPPTSGRSAGSASRARGSDWVPHARWVEDRDRWTSSGVAAGMDMALALIARLHGRDLAQTVADQVELEWHSDPDWDPFAGLYGLD